MLITLGSKDIISSPRVQTPIIITNSSPEFYHTYPYQTYYHIRFPILNQSLITWHTKTIDQIGLPHISSDQYMTQNSKTYLKGQRVIIKH